MHELIEFDKCKNDPSYFAEKYCKVTHVDYGLVDFNLYPYQKNMMNHFNKHRFNIVLACRQSGKSISSVVYILWYAIFHSDKLVAVLANKGSTAREMLMRITLAFENLPFFLQPGAKALNKGSIEFSNGSRIEAHSTSSSSIRGKTVALLYLDEFAFVERDKQFYTSTYPVITSGKQTKVIITSTANGIGNQFYKIWEGAMQKTNAYNPFRVDWWDVPGRDEKWKEETISNTSAEQFEQEFGNSFLGASSTLIDGQALLSMRAQNPIVDHANTKIYAEPAEDRAYIMTVDVAKGRGQDFSTFSIFDVTTKPYKQVATFRDSLISPLIFPDIIYRMARKYNDSYIIVESNDAGQLVFKSIYYDYEYPHMFMGVVKNGRSMGLEMNKKTKRIGCSHLKDLIESRTLEIIDLETISELSLFEAHGDSWAARQGSHDDMVMGLVSFAWFASTPQFNDITQDSLKSIMGAERERLIDGSVPHFGVITTKAIESKFDLIIEEKDKKVGYGIDDVFGREFGVTHEEYDRTDGNQAQKYLF
jgi:hypothetical protein